MFVTVNARASAAGDVDDDDKNNKKKTENDVNDGTVTSECRRQRKVIYEVIV